MGLFVLNEILVSSLFAEPNAKITPFKLSLYVPMVPDKYTLEKSISSSLSPTRFILYLESSFIDVENCKIQAALSNEEERGLHPISVFASLCLA